MALRQSRLASESVELFRIKNASPTYQARRFFVCRLNRDAAVNHQTLPCDVGASL